MTPCYFCNKPLKGEINWHHPELKSKGGTKVVPAHPRCHVEYHSRSNHFREWGRIGGQISSIDKHWAFTLKNVKSDPLYNQARDFYKAHYA